MLERLVFPKPPCSMQLGSVFAKIIPHMAPFVARIMRALEIKRKQRKEKKGSAVKLLCHPK